MTGLDLFPQSTAEALDILSTLDDEQYLAATVDSGSALVRAGAGTGKTRTLVARIAFLIREKKIQPERITAVTFTKKAAKEIRERIASQLGRDMAERLVVGTFHSISARILRRYAHLVGLSHRFTICSEEEALFWVASAIQNLRVFDNEEDAAERGKAVACLAKQAQQAIHNWKSWGLTPKMVEERSGPRPDPQEELFARIYVSYQYELQKQGLADFGDLLAYVLDIFDAHPEIRRSESERVRHLLIDEAQDANPTQVRWVQQISDVYGNVFAVGDEDQSIFSFQGGSPLAMEQMTGPRAKHFSLTINRRCTEQMLAPAVKLVNWNRRSSKKVLCSGRDGSDIELRVAGNEREEATAIASSIKHRISSGVSASDIAVLVRSGFAMKPIEEALLKANIDYQLIGATAFTKREEIQDLIAYLNLAQCPTNMHAFARISGRPTRGIGEATLAEIHAIAQQRFLTYAQACGEVTHTDGHAIADDTIAGIRRFASKLAAFNEAFTDSDLTTAEFVDIVLSPEGFGYRDFVGKKKKDQKKLENIKIFERLAAEEPDLTTFLQEIALSAGEEHQEGREAVRISTMHSSKGLEWAHVYCPGFEIDLIPSKKSMSEQRFGTFGDPWSGPSTGGVEEERRLAHVAFTRAKETLSVSCALSRSERRAHPSPFLPEAGLDPVIAGDFEDRGRVRKARESRAEPTKGRKGFASQKW